MTSWATGLAGVILRHYSVQMIRLHVFEKTDAIISIKWKVGSMPAKLISNGCFRFKDVYIRNWSRIEARIMRDLSSSIFIF